MSNKTKTGEPFRVVEYIGDSEKEIVIYLPSKDKCVEFIYSEDRGLHQDNYGIEVLCVNGQWFDI